MARKRGTERGETIAGTWAADDIDGRGGNDTIRAGGGNDLVHGGKGNDRMFGGAGDDWLWGDDGADVLVGGDGNDRLYGGGINNKLYGEGGDDVLVYNPGAVDLGKVDISDQYIDGGMGSDTLYLSSDAYYGYGAGERFATSLQVGISFDGLGTIGEGDFVDEPSWATGSFRNVERIVIQDQQALFNNNSATAVTVDITGVTDYFLGWEWGVGDNFVIGAGTGSGYWEVFTGAGVAGGGTLTFLGFQPTVTYGMDTTGILPHTVFSHEGKSWMVEGAPLVAGVDYFFA